MNQPADAGRHSSPSRIVRSSAIVSKRGAIHIDGTDSRCYTPTIPAGVRGNVFEEVVLSELRPQGQKTSTATLTGPLVAVAATVLTGTSFTAKVCSEREQWLAYGSGLRTNSQLHEVGAPGIATWGKPLVYATALGAAPTAAGALGAG